MPPGQTPLERFRLLRATMLNAVDVFDRAVLVHDHAGQARAIELLELLVPRTSEAMADVTGEPYPDEIEVA